MFGGMSDVFVPEIFEAEPVEAIGASPAARLIETPHKRTLFALEVYDG